LPRICSAASIGRDIDYGTFVAVSLGLSAPAAVPVEVRTGDRRVFRLSLEIGTGGVRLERPAPFEPGEPVRLRFGLPGQPHPVEIDAQVVTTGDPLEEEGERGGLTLLFLSTPPDTLSAISTYISDRLGIPLPPVR
jgi:hypothetical protein